MLYAVTRVGAAVPTGLDSLAGDRVAVIHSARPVAAGSDGDGALAFGLVLQQLAHGGPTLPMRYGTAVADLSELRRLIAEHEDVWSTRLVAVADCCELIVHLGNARRTLPVPAWAQLTPSECLVRQAEAALRRDDLHDELRDELRPWLRELRSLPGDVDDRLAVMVPRDAAVPTSIRLRRWAADHPDLRVSVTGPRPPFSFCDPAA